ncbi:NUDIX hydrolase [Prosthecomicrobium hirschii]|uniref:NUDIX hydrolase n=1 Tax=Prosthecodimorpha hirschii TaxID=665126 RepID=A0A0P6VVW3_9HYPH|nr:NUDIX hydrolase [Prosthecomicrobium hirschii]KPL51027.1 NUDIX hydrolase [Prosthecomicrobium hirschii]
MNEKAVAGLSDRLAKLNNEIRDTTHANQRPKDAATLLILDRTAGAPLRVLMGRRHMRHRFFPGAYVFPGGKVDVADSFVPVATPYDEATAAKIGHDLKRPKTTARARAFGVAAIRETFEEAGLFIGTRADGNAPKLKGDMAAFSERSIAIALDRLRFVARAITPPRRPRRFDTRFFACFAGDIVDRLEAGVGPSGELEDVAWLTIEEAKRTQIPPITVAILDEIEDRLASDPTLDPTAPIPYYRWVGKTFQRSLI